jgi:signal transduction histidine kinase
VRNLCRGLTLPELEGLSLAQTLERAIGAHERRTGCAVDRDFSAGPWPEMAAPHPILICIYRFVQEGLMNAYRHAPGAAVRVGCDCAAGRLIVFVADEGPGFDPEQVRPVATAGLGLPGLRERVESIGGSFRIDTALGAGVHVSIDLPLEGAK